MRDMLSKFFSKAAASSKEDAKKRLKFLLIHDQVDLSPAQLDEMKTEIMNVIAKYVDIDVQNTDFRLERGDGAISLVSSVPVRRVHERAAASAK